MTTKKRQTYRFMIPQVKERLIGRQGEVACYIPYRIEDDLTAENILQELRKQPHMVPLANYISENRRIYLIEGESMEMLYLAAEYVGSYHNLVEGTWGMEIVETEDGFDYDEFSQDVSGSTEGDSNDSPSARTFDFSANMPLLRYHEISSVYAPSNGCGVNEHFYLDTQRARTPWWTMSQEGTIIIDCSLSYLGGLPRILQAMDSYERIIVLKQCGKCPPGIDSLAMRGGLDLMSSIIDLGFEMETETVAIGEPEDDSDYRKDVLCQLGRERGGGFAPKTNYGKILSMIKENRGNVRNETLTKAVANALLRKKDGKKLNVRDFEYLSVIQEQSRNAERADKDLNMELVGQEAVRLQMKHIVDSMVFQKRRSEMGLPADKIHYTFAFMGAPGTGKTTWAMRLAMEMKERGLLENTESICMNAAELKALYVGHTTQKVKSIFEQYGVIILDEAYSLSEGENGDSYGAEAMAQLCVELENHANDRLVVFAGYGGSNNSDDNRMLRFLQSNPGINSRISFKIHFENFRAEELVEVFHRMMSCTGYQVPNSEDQAIADFFAARKTERAFGNCREVRNLIDRVKIHLAARMSAEGRYAVEDMSRVMPEDIRAAMEEIAEEYCKLSANEARAIGFSK